MIKRQARGAHLPLGTSINLISRAIGVVRSMLAIRTYV